MRLEITSKNMDELTDSDISDIEYILESNSNSTFFHSLEYLRVIRKVSSLIPKFIIARKGDKALGYFPFFSKPRYKIFRAK